MVDTRVKGLIREALVSDTSVVHVDGIIRETLFTKGTSQLNINGIAREILQSGIITLQIDGIAREILRTSDLYTNALHNRLFLQSEATFEEILRPVRKFISVAPPTPINAQKPWQRNVLNFADSGVEDWHPVRKFTFVALPIPFLAKPWLHRLSSGVDSSINEEEIWHPVRKFSIIVTTVVKKIRAYLWVTN